jgi:glycosyltransferase involved in cell wall biosynthesis
MPQKIVLLNTWHYSFDDRVFYHQAKSLAGHGFEIMIISTKEDCIKECDNISINSFNDSNLSRDKKMEKIQTNLTHFSPRIIICDSPLAVLAAYRYKKDHPVHIIYDITEWYPSKIHLQHKKGVQRILNFFVLLTFNLLAGIRSDSFIFGEYYKSIEYRKLFFWKRYCKLPYYPDTDYIQYYPLKEINSEMNLLYTGKINQDKGIDAVIGAIKTSALKCPEIQFKLKIIGNFPTNDDQLHFNILTSDLNGNIHINILKPLPFLEFCKTIGDTHLFFDLRKMDIENTHCLPIKLFYYLACGRPVIYSNLKSIRKEIKNFDFGYLCDPADGNSISAHIVDYITNPVMYAEHSSNALNISKSTYNWKAIERDFISFIENTTY